MNRSACLAVVLVFLFLVGYSGKAWAQEDDLYSFDVEEFTKKVWEWKGELSVYGTGKFYNKDSVLYPVKFPEEEISDSQEGKLQLYLESRWDWDWSRLILSGEASGVRSSIENSNEESAFLSEGYWQLAVFDPHIFEIGKRLLRWGKGYAFNPVALMERAKNPEDPEANREGLWITQGIWISGGFSVFESSSVTLAYLPVREDINYDFQKDLLDENLWGIKLYGLIGTTDIDLYFVRWTEQEESDWGFDFSSNISANFEIHGEFAVFETVESDEQKSLLGLRYLTENEVTWIAEVYNDSAGLTKEDSRQLYEKIEGLSPAKALPYLAQIQQNKTLNRNYGYLKVSVKEPFDWLYFTPSYSWLGNLDDGSSNNAVQLAYTPSDNWTFQVILQHLVGDEYTQYGENIVKNKVELSAYYSF